MANNTYWPFAGGATVDKVPCALVLEDNPTLDGRLDFESFPQDGVEEAYATTGYEEIGGSSLSQPYSVIYRGGNWSDFSLELQFRANYAPPGVSLTDSIFDAGQHLEAILIAMEHKVRWCQALTMPRDSDITAHNDRIAGLEQQAAHARATGGAGAAAQYESEISNLKAAAAVLKNYDPPYVLVVFGSFMVLRCYVRQVSVKWEHPFHPVTCRPYGATVRLSMQRLEKERPSWRSVAYAALTPQMPLATVIAGQVVVADAQGRGLVATRQLDNAAARASALAGGGEAAAVLSV